VTLQIAGKQRNSISGVDIHPSIGHNYTMTKSAQFIPRSVIDFPSEEALREAAIKVRDKYYANNADPELLTRIEASIIDGGFLGDY
jgi:hypothetical protein